MKKVLGAVCMTIGAVLLVGALALFIWNQAEASKAKRSVREVVPLIKNSIATDDHQEATSPIGTDFIPSEKIPMAEVQINGNNYIGLLTVPALELELPVMSGWDYSKLKISPCRYSGAIAEENLVIIAHNYPGHFGYLNQLEIEDKVLFTDVKGTVNTYQVVSVDVVPPTSAEEVVAGDFDLALVTCTYSGQTRLVVYCDEK